MTDVTGTRAIPNSVRMILVPEDVLTDAFNLLSDCLCYPPGTHAQQELVDKLDALLGEDDDA